MQKECSKNYDLRKILKPFENKWVALTSDNKRVIGHAKSLEELTKKTLNKDAVFMKVLPFSPSYAPTTL
jgi:hypothetical protein